MKRDFNLHNVTHVYIGDARYPVIFAGGSDHVVILISSADTGKMPRGALPWFGRASKGLLYTVPVHGLALVREAVS